jgi:hypothetical protein
MLGVSSLGGKGTSETGRTGTPITELISWGSIRIICPLNKVWMMEVLCATVWTLGLQVRTRFSVYSKFLL